MTVSVLIKRNRNKNTEKGRGDGMRLIDADALRQEISVDKYGHIETTITKLNIALEHCTVDAVKVTRCKDCKHWLDVTEVEDGVRYAECELFSDEHEFGENWFCKDGERREVTE